jgi:hypothetical protein
MVPVRVDQQLAVAGPGARLPRPGERDLGEPVELAHVPERERAQERADRRGRQHPVPEHAAGRPGPQQLNVVDAVATSKQAVDQGQDLGPRVGRARPVAEVDQLVGGLLHAQPLGQGRGQQQPGARDRVLVIEGDIDLVEGDVRGSHRKGASDSGIMTAWQPSFSLVRGPFHNPGALNRSPHRWIQVEVAVLRLAPDGSIEDEYATLLNPGQDGRWPASRARHQRRRPADRASLRRRRWRRGRPAGRRRRGGPQRAL